LCRYSATGVVNRRFNMTSADIIFSKVAEGAKSLTYTDFLWMLVLAAEEKAVDYEDLAQQVGVALPEAVRLVTWNIPAVINW
jgi:hypothetical protein